MMCWLDKVSRFLFQNKMFRQSEYKLLPSAPPYEQDEEHSQETQEDKQLDLIWTSFFNAVFVVGESALKKKWISQADCQEQEAFLFLGLPAATILNAILRSLALTTEAIQLVHGGDIINATTCPQKHKHMFTAMIKVRRALQKAALTKEEIKVLYYATLQGDSDAPKHPAMLPKQLRVKINRIVAQIHNIAIYVSQEAFYKAQMNTILSLLGELEL